MDQPPIEIIAMAEKQLYRFGALDEKGYITEQGFRMVNFPLEPYLSKMLIASINFECSDEIITTISMMGIQNLFKRSREAPLRKVKITSNSSNFVKSMFSNFKYGLNLNF